MAKIKKSIEIAASPSEVWDVLKELEKMHEWITNMKSLKITSEKRYSKGVSARAIV